MDKVMEELMEIARRKEEIKKEKRLLKESMFSPIKRKHPQSSLLDTTPSKMQRAAKIPHERLERLNREEESAQVKDIFTKLSLLGVQLKELSRPHLSTLAQTDPQYAPCPSHQNPQQHCTLGQQDQDVDILEYYLL